MSNKHYGIIFILTISLLFISFLFSVYSVGAERKININTASKKELCLLKRVGAAYSERIIKYREEVGPFKTPEEIINVAGIGRKIFEINRDVIVVKDEPTPKKAKKSVAK